MFWQPEEVDRLLAILLEMGVGDRIMCSTRLEAISIYNRLARTLSASGFPWRGWQCQSKFKRVKGALFGMLEAWQGIPPYKARPPHFQKRLSLWYQAGSPPWDQRRHASLCCIVGHSHTLGLMYISPTVTIYLSNYALCLCFASIGQTRQSVTIQRTEHQDHLTRDHLDLRPLETRPCLPI